MTSLIPAIRFCIAVTAAGFAAAARSDELTLHSADGLPQGLAPAVSEKLEPRRLKLKTADGDDLCEIWTTNTWETGGERGQPDDFAPIDYGLLPGSLVGALALLAPCVDVREQELPPGLYTLRYAVQPDLDTHRDSHDSRDFLLLLPAADDLAPEAIIDLKRLMAASASVIQTTHPAVIPLVKPTATERQELLRVDDKDPQGRILLLRGRSANEETIPLELIVPRRSTTAP